MCKILMVVIVFFNLYLIILLSLGVQLRTYHYLDFWSVKIFLLATCCGYMQLLNMIITLI